MNYLVYEGSEIDNEGCITVTGERARHLIAVVGVERGARLRMTELGVRRLSGEVVGIESGRVRIRPGATERTVSGPLIDLIVALPRPQSVKKIVELGAALGVRRLNFFGAARVERSFFSSSVLRSESITHHLRLGLEQGGAVSMPTVGIFPELSPERFPENFPEHFEADGWRHARYQEYLKLVDSGSIKFVLHPKTDDDSEREVGNSGAGTEELLKSCAVSPDRVLTFAIGPEGGWIPRELAHFRELGFLHYILGPQIVRVETAVGMILGQVEMARAIGTHALLNLTNESPSVVVNGSGAVMDSRISPTH